MCIVGNDDDIDHLPKLVIPVFHFVAFSLSPLRRKNVEGHVSVLNRDSNYIRANDFLHTLLR